MWIFFIILFSGGSLKKYTKVNSNGFVVGIIIPILVFFISMNITYAYFTASTSSKQASSTTAIIKISLNTTATPKLNSTEISDNTKVLPGDTLQVKAKVSNSVKSDVYVLLELIIWVKKSTDEEGTIKVQEFYTLNNSALELVTGTTDNYTNTAFTLTAETNTSEITFEHTFDFDEYDNTYKNAESIYRITAYAIQTTNVTNNAMGATDLLIQMAESNTLVVD